MRTALLKALAREVKRGGTGGTPSSRLKAAAREWDLTIEELFELKKLSGMKEKPNAKV